MNTLQFAGQVALVTGASRGIGAAIALELAKQGLKVVGTATTPEGASKVNTALAGYADCSGRVLDVTDGVAVDALVDAVTKEQGSLHILVNNAGITRDNLAMRMKDEDWDAVMDTNLRGLFLCTRAVLRPMTRARWGRIINITSVVGLMGNAGQANYAAAKAGIIGFTKSVAREIGSRTITVNAVAPGFIDTELTASLGPETREALIKQIPLGRLGNPDDVAGLVTFLASEQAAYITGQTFNSDGGMVMQ